MYDVQTVGVLTGFQRGFDAIVSPAEMKILKIRNVLIVGNVLRYVRLRRLTGLVICRMYECSFDEKTVIVQTAPAVRVAIGEAWHEPW